MQDPAQEEYERRVYSIFDLTGQLGGVYEILLITGGFLTSSFWSKIYLCSVFSCLYYTEEDANEDDNKERKQKYKANPSVKSVQTLQRLQSKANNQRKIKFQIEEIRGI